MIEFLIKLRKIIDKLIIVLSDCQFNKKYYVYNPAKNAPRKIHNSLSSAIHEAKRIAELEPCGFSPDIQVLQIIATIECSGIPL